MFNLTLFLSALPPSSTDELPGITLSGPTSGRDISTASKGHPCPNLELGRGISTKNRGSDRTRHVADGDGPIGSRTGR